MYLIFAGHDYYPSGGVDDYVGSCETIDESMIIIEKAFAELQYGGWVHLAQITDGGLITIGHGPSWIDAIGVGGWLRGLQKVDGGN